MAAVGEDHRDRRGTERRDVERGRTSGGRTHGAVDDQVGVAGRGGGAAGDGVEEGQVGGVDEDLPRRGGPGIGAHGGKNWGGQGPGDLNGGGCGRAVENGGVGSQAGCSQNVEALGVAVVGYLEGHRRVGGDADGEDAAGLGSRVRASGGGEWDGHRDGAGDHPEGGGKVFEGHLEIGQALGDKSGTDHAHLRSGGGHDRLGALPRRWAAGRTADGAVEVEAVEATIGGNPQGDPRRRQRDLGPHGQLQGGERRGGLHDARADAPADNPDESAGGDERHGSRLPRCGPQPSPELHDRSSLLRPGCRTPSMPGGGRLRQRELPDQPYFTPSAWADALPAHCSDPRSGVTPW